MRQHCEARHGARRDQLTEWEKFEPQVEDTIDEHGVYVDKQNDRVHAGQFEVINRLVHDIQQDAARICIIRPVRAFMARLVAVNL